MKKESPPVGDMLLGSLWQCTQKDPALSLYAPNLYQRRSTALTESENMLCCMNVRMNWEEESTCVGDRMLGSLKAMLLYAPNLCHWRSAAWSVPNPYPHEMSWHLLSLGMDWWLEDLAFTLLSCPAVMVSSCQSSIYHYLWTQSLSATRSTIWDKALSESRHHYKSQPVYHWWFWYWYIFC